MGKISHFYNPGIAVDQEEGERQGNKLIKKALLLVSGSHKDSKKRPHVFEVERIHQIADNTNRVLSEYGRIPLIKDHNKTSDSTIGDLEGEVFTKVITRADLPDPRLTDLIGKTGIFTNNLVVKSKQAIQGFMEGVHRTISPGIDVDTDEIREISVTPLPAIKGLMAFHKGEANGLRKFALTLDEAEQETDDLDQLKEQFEEKGELFWTVVESVSSAEEDALQGADPRELLMQAVNDYVERIVELLQLNEEPEEEDTYGQMQPQQGQAPMRQGYPPQRAFSMANTERNRAEFGLGQAIRKAGVTLRSGFRRAKTSSIKQQFPRKIGFLGSTRANLAGVGGAAARGYQRSGLIRNTANATGVAAVGAGGYAGYRALTRKKRIY